MNLKIISQKFLHKDSFQSYVKHISGQWTIYDSLNAFKALDSIECF